MSASTTRRTVGVAEFKARCTHLIEEVRRTRQPLLVTRRGQPVVLVVAPPDLEVDDANPLLGTILHEDDIVSPAVEASEWEAMR